MPNRLDVRFVFHHPAHFLACGFGAGLAPVAPGTFGTLVAFPLAHLLILAGPVAYALFVVAGFGVGVWACERAGRDLGVPDHGGIVWDEVIAMLLVLFFVINQPVLEVCAFIAFRLFDIIKPPPIGSIDRRWKSGFGVMADDLMAAAYALLALAVGVRVVDLIVELVS